MGLHLSLSSPSLFSGLVSDISFKLAKEYFWIFPNLHLEIQVIYNAHGAAWRRGKDWPPQTFFRFTLYQSLLTRQDLIFRENNYLLKSAWFPSKALDISTLIVLFPVNISICSRHYDHSLLDPLPHKNS